MSDARIAQVSGQTLRKGVSDARTAQVSGQTLRKGASGARTAQVSGQVIIKLPLPPGEVSVAGSGDTTSGGSGELSYTASGAGVGAVAAVGWANLTIDSAVVGETWGYIPI